MVHAGNAIYNGTDVESETVICGDRSKVYGAWIRIDYVSAIRERVRSTTGWSLG